LGGATAKTVAKLLLAPARAIKEMTKPSRSNPPSCDGNAKPTAKGEIPNALAAG